MAAAKATAELAEAAEFAEAADTDALIWLHTNHRRTRRLAAASPLYVSPATILELQFLIELGRIRLRRGAGVGAVVDDDRWLADDPPAAAWFTRALALAWTNDPFDRLIVAHAQLRGWRLATSDPDMLAQMSATARVEL